MNDINSVKMILYITEVLLVHLDLSDIRGVVGCVDLVLLLMVDLTIQTLWMGRRGHMSLFHPIKVSQGNNVCKTPPVIMCLGQQLQQCVILHH